MCVLVGGVGNYLLRLFDRDDNGDEHDGDDDDDTNTHGNDMCVRSPTSSFLK